MVETNPSSDVLERKQHVFALAQALGAVVPVEMPWPQVKELARYLAGCTVEQLATIERLSAENETLSLQNAARESEIEAMLNEIERLNAALTLPQTNYERSQSV